MANRIIVDLDTSKSIYNIFECKQNDDLTLEANIFQNGIAKDITNAMITINCTRADGTFVIQNTDITKEANKITVNLNRDFTRVDGLDKFEIVLIENGKQDTTFDFNILVKASVIKGAVQSENTVTILEELGNKIVEAGLVKAETENLIATGGAATTGQVAEINTQLADIMYNVKTFGAKGDGVTDDTLSIQTAIDSGYKIYFPPNGVYLVSGLSLTTSKKIEIAQGTVIKQKTGSLIPLLSVNGVTDFSLLGGIFEADINNTSSNTIDISNSEKVNIKTKVINSGRNGISINNCGSGKIDTIINNTKLSGLVLIDSSNFDINVDIDGTDGSGVLVTPTNKDIEYITVSGVIKNCARVVSTAIGVYFNSGGAVDNRHMVRNSTIKASVYNAGFVGIFPGGDYNTCIGCSVVNTGLVTTPSASGIYVHDSAHIKLIGCTVINAGRAGFAVIKAHGITFDGCQSIGNKQQGFLFVYDGGTTGVYQGDTTNKDITLLGCFANNNGQSLPNAYSGYHIDGFRNIQFVGCHAHDYQDIKTQQTGIRAVTNANCKDISIVSCNFTDNISSGGIIVDASYLTNVMFKDGLGTKLGFYGGIGVVKPSSYTLTNVTTDRVLDSNATTIDELADVLGTLITDLKNIGLIG